MTSPSTTPDKPLTPRQAWQPFTPRGVAAFALATLTRLVLVQLAVAALVAFALLWYLRVAWSPVVTESIQHLPEAGVIQRGELIYGGEPLARLAENKRLALVVDLAGTREAGHVADLEIVFEKNRVVLRGPLGNWWQPYDARYSFSFNRPELGPWWGAWQWPILALVALATVISLFVMWWGLAFLYVPLVKLLAFFADRAVTWRGAWRLSAAALLPGAALVGLALVLHGFGAVDLLGFALLYALHLLAGLIFNCTSPFFLPKFSEAVSQKNPFGAPSDLGSVVKITEAPTPPAPNPFTRRDGA